LVLVAGLMSGTSADAIDVALVDIRGQGWNARIKLRGFHSIPYKAAVRERILSIAGGAAVSAREISQLNFLLGELFGRACIAACRRFRVPMGSLQLIGSHGQTIHHQAVASPECGIPTRSTLQIGEPAMISAITGAKVISDFRPADMAAGGQGAPLVPYFDYLMYRHPKRGRIILNIGGIANLTAIPAGAPPEKIVAFDTGPGNMLIDQLVSRISRGRQHFDDNGKLAAKGVLDEKLIRRMLSQRYFAQRPPKSTGREQFGGGYIDRWFRIGVDSPRHTQANAIATATGFTAATIAEAIRQFVLPLGTMHDCIVSGGGIRNAFLIEQIRERLSRVAPIPSGLSVTTTESRAIPSHAKEAAAFALLAYQTHHGQPSNLPAATGATRAAILGNSTYIGGK
jgi:anhydro-N-acetylmuramic acid kinase